MHLITLTLAAFIGLILLNIGMLVLWSWLIFFKFRKWIWVHSTILISRLIWGSTEARINSMKKNRALLTSKGLPDWIPLSIGNLYLRADRMMNAKPKKQV